MNNLLRTLTESQQSHLLDGADLRLLLTSVKEARRQNHDSKASDAFYDSLDGLLQDLRTVTPDNRDAEAFLKPVAKSEVPDYYDIIHSPMDLQTMQKKVKQKQYKSKREFKDDLDLIWSNCFTYNATENHPLRQCASRLKVKAESLLKNITDRKERIDPVLPASLISRDGTPRPNGVNGHSVARTRPVAFTKSPSPSKQSTSSTSSKQARRDVPFPDTPAIVRTVEDMAAFMELDRELEMRLRGEPLANGFSGPSLEDKLRSFSSVGANADEDDGFMAMDVDVGEKRKLNGHTDSRPRKRIRASTELKDASDLWWDAMLSDVMIGNSIPSLRYASSEDSTSIPTPTAVNDPPRRPGVRARKKRKKRAPGPEAEKTLLYHINNNIRTLRRTQITHAKIAVLKESIAADESQQSGPTQLTMAALAELNDADDTVDDRPWRAPGSGLELGEENANDCLRWMSSKVLQHIGFQGSSKVALDVMVGIAADYLNSLGRTIQFLCDKYANRMSAEEIILHALFASGTTRVNELERYINDDILRSGSRMMDLEKKLLNTYEDLTSGETWDDDALFRAEDEEEDGEFVMGNFADSFGEDFLGLRELGIADEFGLASLTIPKKLLKGKNRGLKDPLAAKPSEPPPPFPPPPPFVPLDSQHLDDQIGLLKPYYQQRIDALSGPATQPSGLPAASSSSSISLNVPSILPSHIPSPLSSHLPPAEVQLLDDVIPTPHTKIGPLGQILKSAPQAAASKKKSAAKPKAQGPAAPGPSDGGDGVPATETPAATPTATAPETPRKPKATPAKKKKGSTIEILPPIIAASA